MSITKNSNNFYEFLEMNDNDNDNFIDDRMSLSRFAISKKEIINKDSLINTEVKELKITQNTLENN